MPAQPQQGHLAGYVPIATRRIGQAPPSSVMPIGLLQHPAEADGGSDEEEHLPPEHGFSAFHAYGPSEVLLQDFSAQHDPTHVHHPLDPPLPLAMAETVHAYEVHFRPRALFALEHPTRIAAHGAEYEFVGLTILTQHALPVPSVPLLCAGKRVRTELIEVDAPKALLASADERRALGKLQRLLHAQFHAHSGAIDAVDDGHSDYDGDAGAAGEPARHLHFLPRFVRVEAGASSGCSGRTPVSSSSSSSAAAAAAQAERSDQLPPAVEEAAPSEEVEPSEVDDEAMEWRAIAQAAAEVEERAALYAAAAAAMACEAVADTGGGRRWQEPSSRRRRDGWPRRDIGRRRVCAVCVRGRLHGSARCQRVGFRVGPIAQSLSVVLRHVSTHSGSGGRR